MKRARLPLALLPALLAAGCTPVLTSPPDTGGGEWVAPENSWPSSAPPDDLQAEGFGRGQVPPDFRMTDQYGDQVALWQFYGLVVVLDFSTMWCGPCQELAGSVEETWEAYRDQGFIYVTVLSENLESEVPSVEELQQWAELFGIEAPVLADGEGYTDQVVTDEAFPRVMVLDRELRVAEPEVTPVDDATIRSVVESLL